MNYLYRISDWGTVRCVCTHPEPGATHAHVELTDTAGARIELTPDAADELAAVIVRTPHGESATIAVDGVTLAELPAGLIDTAASKIHRAADKARAQWREPSQRPHKFLLAGK